MSASIDPPEDERAGASGEDTGSGLNRTAVTPRGDVNHGRVLLPLGTLPRVESFPYREIDRRNGWDPKTDKERALLNEWAVANGVDADVSREAMGLAEFLRIVNDNTTGRGGVADMQQRFLTFVAACWVIGAPWLDGQGLRQVAESLNVSHETLRLRAQRISGALEIRTRTLSPEHKHALSLARAARRAKDQAEKEQAHPSDHAVSAI